MTIAAGNFEVTMTPCRLMKVRRARRSVAPLLIKKYFGELEAVSRARCSLSWVKPKAAPAMSRWSLCQAA